MFCDRSFMDFVEVKKGETAAESSCSSLDLFRCEKYGVGMKILQ